MQLRGLSPVESVYPKVLVAVFVCSLGEYGTKPRQGTRVAHLFDGKIQIKDMLEDKCKNHMARINAIYMILNNFIISNQSKKIICLILKYFAQGNIIPNVDALK